MLSFSHLSRVLKWIIYLYLHLNTSMDNLHY